MIPAPPATLKTLDKLPMLEVLQRLLLMRSISDSKCSIVLGTVPGSGRCSGAMGCLAGVVTRLLLPLPPPGMLKRLDVEDLWVSGVAAVECAWL